MKEIIEVIKNKYNINDINHLYINNDIQLIEFNINVYVDVKILKNKDHYIILLSMLNSNVYPTKNISIYLEYKTYDKLLYDLEYFNFHYS